MLTRTFNDLSVFKDRRKRLSEQQPQAGFLFFSGTEGHLAVFRPASSFVYLTGFEEPEAAVFIRTGQNPQYTLFVRDKDPAIEIWDGERYGPEQAGTVFEADQCFSINELEQKLPELMKDIVHLYYHLGESSDNDRLVLQARQAAQGLRRRSGLPQLAIHDPNEILAPMRRVKDAAEIAQMRESCALTARAHLRVMEYTRPGKNEKQAQGDFLFGIYQEKAMREGYCSILASGANACTLHYRANNREMQDGDFLLIDAGGEKGYYTADITRTYPVNGKFTDPQKRLYQAVLDVQKALIEKVRVDFSLPELHELSCQLLCQKLIDLGLLDGTVEENLAEGQYKRYYPHGIGHYLGMDVHDVGFSKKNDKPVPFEPGVVITVEPGIYVPADDTSAPEELRGLGVRIEDDVLVTSGDPEVLTALAPKEIADLEAIVGSKA